MRKPYLAHLGISDSLRCFLVDGEWIRNYRDVDFTNGAHHYVRPYVPLREIWIDREAPGAGEIGFLIRHQIRQRSLMAAGVPYLSALRACNRAERRERRAAWKRPLPTGGEARACVRLRSLGAVESDQLFLVDGSCVRALFDPNFTQGGHGLRYRFIPRREVWIDDAAVESERDFIIEHELHELSLMRAGMGYDDAHERALLLERDLRIARRRRRIAI